MRKQLQTDTVKLSSTSSPTPVADLDNIYLESLLWLTPTNPFLDPNGTTNVTFAFGSRTLTKSTTRKAGSIRFIPLRGTRASSRQPT